MEAGLIIAIGLAVAFALTNGFHDASNAIANLDRVINGAKDSVRESEVMQFPPDRAASEMATLLAEGVQHLRDAFARLDGRRDRHGLATDAADAAIKSQRRLERVYRRAMGDLLEVTDVRIILGSRELYRRMTGMSDDIVSVADRVWYSRVKET